MELKNQVVPHVSFEERIKQRLRESIGNMTTDEELSEVIQKAIQMTFFEPPISKDTY